MMFPDEEGYKLTKYGWMYDFSRKSCEVCGDRIGHGPGGFNFFIIEKDNPPVDSICFCGLHQPIFLDECSVDWLGRLKRFFKLSRKNGVNRNESMAM